MSDMFYQKLLKNALDTIASLLLLMPAAVCILILSALIIAYDYGNPIYRQIRVGKDGRVAGNAAGLHPESRRTRILLTGGIQIAENFTLHCIR